MSKTTERDEAVRVLLSELDDYLRGCPDPAKVWPSWMVKKASRLLWRSREAIAALRDGEGEAIGEVDRLGFVVWSNGYFLPPGTKLYATPPAKQPEAQAVAFNYAMVHRFATDNGVDYNALAKLVRECVYTSPHPTWEQAAREGRECGTCEGRGEIGGWRHGEGWASDPCPDCAITHPEQPSGEVRGWEPDISGGQVHVGTDAKSGRTLWHTDERGHFWTGHHYHRTAAQLIAECESTLADIRALATKPAKE